MLATGSKLSKRKHCADPTHLQAVFRNVSPPTQERFLVAQSCAIGSILFNVLIKDLDGAPESMWIKLAVDPEPEGQLGGHLGTLE